MSGMMQASARCGARPGRRLVGTLTQPHPRKHPRTLVEARRLKMVACENCGAGSKGLALLGGSKRQGAHYHAEIYWCSIADGLATALFGCVRQTDGGESSSSSSSTTTTVRKKATRSEAVPRARTRISNRRRPSSSKSRNCDVYSADRIRTDDRTRPTGSHGPPCRVCKWWVPCPPRAFPVRTDRGTLFALTSYLLVSEWWIHPSGVLHPRRHCPYACPV